MAFTIRPKKPPQGLKASLRVHFLVAIIRLPIALLADVPRRVLCVIPDEFEQPARLKLLQAILLDGRPRAIHEMLERPKSVESQRIIFRVSILAKNRHYA
jgi:hypothetical protein